MTTRRQRVLTILAALAAVVVVFVLLRGPREAVPPAPTQDSPASASTPLPAAPLERVAEAAAARPEGIDLEILKRQYEDYKAGSIYPDWSYPLTPDQGFLLSWNAAVTNDLPVDDAHRIFFRFDAE
jgi:hypothetical protein